MPVVASLHPWNVPSHACMYLTRHAGVCGEYMV